MFNVKSKPGLQFPYSNVIPYKNFQILRLSFKVDVYFNLFSESNDIRPFFYQKFTLDHLDISVFIMNVGLNHVNVGSNGYFKNC